MAKSLTSRQRERVRARKLWEAQDAFTQSFVETLLWLGDHNDPDQTPLNDRYDGNDLEYCALLRIERECQMFQLRAGSLIDQDKLLAGCDFCMTRNGHGTGFWCHTETWGDAADSLATLSRQFGEINAYLDIKTCTISVF